MSDIPLPMERLADRMATEWLLAHDRGLTAAEMEAFEAWLTRAPAHAEAWERAHALWSAFEQETDPKMEAILATARATRRPIFSAVTQGIAAAVLVVAALGVGGLIMQRTKQSAPGAQEIADNGPGFTHYAAGGALATIKLADGSDVVLDVGSEIEVRQTILRRDVRLTKGQVFFTVAPDSKRPFVVAAGDNIITDVGTAFAVALQQGATSVILATGRVRVAHGGQATGFADLTPGQQYFEQGDGRLGVVSVVNVASKLAWRTGEMELDDTPLAKAVAELNRHAKTPISVGDAEAGALKLSGRYRLDDSEGFAQSISVIYPVEVHTRRGGGIEIVSRRARTRLGAHENRAALNP